MRLKNRMFEKETTCVLICFSHKWIIKWSMSPYEGTQGFFTARSSSLFLKDRWIDRRVIYICTHTQTHTKAHWTDLCKDMLKDKLSADVLILLNKIPTSTYLIFSPFHLRGPLYLSYSAIQHEQLSPPLFCMRIFFLPSSSLPSPSRRTWATAAL